jgi:hypothetical protein
MVFAKTGARTDRKLIMRKLTVEQCEVISASGTMPAGAVQFETTRKERLVEVCKSRCEMSMFLLQFLKKIFRREATCANFGILRGLEALQSFTPALFAFLGVLDGCAAA